MKKNVSGRKLGRRSSHREAMIQNMAASLFRYGQITTTQMKAKEVQPFAEHMITVARRGDLSSRRQVLRFISEKDVVKMLFDDIAKRNPERKSGFTRILKLGWRKGDSAPMVVFELLDKPKTVAADKDKKEEKGKTKTEKKTAPKAEEPKAAPTA